MKKPSTPAADQECRECSQIYEYADADAHHFVCPICGEEMTECLPAASSAEEKILEKFRETFLYREGNYYVASDSMNLIYEFLEKSLKSFRQEVEREAVERFREEIAKLHKFRWIEHGYACSNGRRPCGGVESPDRLADRCDRKTYDKKTLEKISEILDSFYPKSND